MDLASILLSLALLLLVAAIVLRPLWDARNSGQASAAPQDRSEIEVLISRREGILAALLDLDFDYATGKLETADYEAQRPQLISEGVQVLKKLDALDTGDDVTSVPDLDERIEQAVAKLRVGQHKSNGRLCPHCGKSVNPGNRFCSHCGKQIAPVVESAG